ncbi:MAG: hypothetical protein GW754_02100 [Candidatus Pacebacteria bacterium]|nr:hypothetical protein [Candidatus Pacearchaeota archaeon]NCQ65611.1 hypothetical protein [Candidatus Paceibacterota bacterium]NCS86823.1 hypothetical protein [Candidatus Paceibacterota bacterium]
MKLLKTISHLFHPQKSNNHRSKILHPKPLMFMTLIALGFYQLVGVFSFVNLPKGNVLGYASNITISQIIEGTNKERVSQGLVALTYNTSLSEAATGKARDMFTDQYWAHTSPGGKEPWDFIKSVNYNYKVAGENLARDFDSTTPMITAWMNSPTHKANIMNPRYRDIGLAVVDGKLNGVETTLVVQIFGTLATDTESSTTPSVEVAGITLENFKQQEVLATSVVPQGYLSQGILLSPLHLLKAFFLSIIFLLIAVLLYDGFVAGHRKSVRLVGKNLAHIILFIFIAYLVVFFKGGVV